MFQFRRLVSVLCLLALFVSTARAEEPPKPRGEKIVLEMRLKKGDQKSLIYKMDLTSSATVQGQAFDVAMKMGMFLGTKVEDVDAQGIHTLKLSYDRITMDMVSPVFAMSYDSKEPEKAAKNPAFDMFNAMIGQAITMKIQPDGTTKEVLGIDELAKKLSEKAPAGMNVKQQLEGMKNAFEQFAVYPGKPVDIGDTWNRKIKMAADPNTPMDIDANYTLYDRKNGTAIVKMQGTITAANGMKGTNSGTLMIDEATGWITGGDMVMDMGGEVQGATVKVKGKSTISDK